MAVEDVVCGVLNSIVWVGAVVVCGVLDSVVWVAAVVVSVALDLYFIRKPRRLTLLSLKNDTTTDDPEEVKVNGLTFGYCEHTVLTPFISQRSFPTIQRPPILTQTLYVEVSTYLTLVQNVSWEYMIIIPLKGSWRLFNEKMKSPVQNIAV